MRANLCDEEEPYHAFCVQEGWTEVRESRRAGPRPVTLDDFWPKKTETQNKYAALEEEE